MDLSKTDTIIGKDDERQMMLGISYLIAFVLSWYIFKLGQYVALAYMLNDNQFASDWINSRVFIPWNVFLMACLWIGGLEKYFGMQGENTVRVTSNLFRPQLLEGGGTRFIVYTTGWFLKSFTESEGFEVNIEQEQKTDSSVFTSSVKKIALEMQLRLVWLPHQCFLSAFFQNGSTKEERDENLDNLLALAREMAEVIASKMPSSEHARAGQKIIADKVKKYLVSASEDIGFYIKHVIFLKCDYPADVQKVLNSGIEAQTIAEIAAKLQQELNIPGDKAAELAGLYAKIPGLKIDRKVLEIEAPEHVSDAMKAAGPALAAALAAFFAAQKDKKSTDGKPSKPPTPKKKK
jgi:hypothetical protein